MGRKQKYRNAAERQKAYRERKKQQKSKAEALRKKGVEQESKRIKACVERAGTIAFWDIYRDKIRQPQPGHYACPCGRTQIPITRNPNDLSRCSYCRGSIAGAVAYFEKPKDS